MAGSLFLSTKNVFHTKGSVGRIAGPVLTFDLVVNGTPRVELLEAAALEFWKPYFLGIPQAIWFRRAVREPGTPDIASWAAALVVGLQWVAGDPVGPGRVLEAHRGGYSIVVPVGRRSVVEAALPLALRILMLWQRDPAPTSEELTDLLSQVDNWLGEHKSQAVNNTIFRLIMAARARNVPVDLLPTGDCSFGWGMAARRLGDTTVNSPHGPGVYQSWLRQVLADASFPVNRTFLGATPDQIADGAADFRHPLYLSPLIDAAADWVQSQVGSPERLLPLAKQRFSLKHELLLLQEKPAGDIHQCLLVRGKLQLCLREKPKHVDRTVYRSYDDLTLTVHTANREMLERAAEVLALDVVMITVHSVDVSRPFDESAGNPGRIMECLPPRSFPAILLNQARLDTAWMIVSNLLGNDTARVPICAISGSFGSATTSRMLMFIWSAVGRQAALVAASGTWLGESLLSHAKPMPVSAVPGLLRHPKVGALVFEVPESGLVGDGHPVDTYDVACLMNFQAGHALQRGRDVVERLAREKGLVVEPATGAVVVNADDDVCTAQLPRAGCKRVILVSASGLENAALKAHQVVGGEIVGLEVREQRTWAVLRQARSTTPVMPLDEIPATEGGLIRSVMEQALFAIAVAVGHDIDLGIIRKGLQHFTTERY